MTDYEVLTELMNWNPDYAKELIDNPSIVSKTLIKYFRVGFKTAIEFIEKEAYEATDYEYAIWHAKRTIGE